MPTHVYANGREIASQSADGVAPAAFPDACWSPPPPPAGPVVIPYANFTRASKLRNGTRRIFIKGKTVALENKSYFVNSTGNEPATYAFGKGFMTGALKGKAYFQSWSLTVLFEGRGVARHMDLVSHNHGSHMGNTPPFPYLSQSSLGKTEPDCDAYKKDMEDKCKGPNSPDWRTDHCVGLDGKQLVSGKKLMSPEKSIEYARNLKLPENGPALTKKFKELQAAIKAQDDGKPLSKGQEEHIANAQKIASNQQAQFARLNDCLSARKCHLVPYGKGKISEDKAPSTRSGCCPAQTGHHLIPDVMVRKADPPCNKDYDRQEALTVCVEGTSQDFGSHRLIHKSMDRQVKDMADADGFMSLDKAIKAAVNSHMDTFKLSKCRHECIEAQLNDYFSGKCKNSRLKAEEICKKRGSKSNGKKGSDQHD